MITEDYCSYEVAKLLKEKGFDENCLTGYDVDRHIISYSSKTIAAPTHQMAMKWLRKVHNRFIEICTDKAHNFKDIIFRPAIYDKELDCLWESDNFITYEDAVEAALKYALEDLI